MISGRAQEHSGTSIILASASPRRRELLERMGLSFRVLASTVDEDRITSKSPEGFASQAAYAKCADVASQVEDDLLVVAADTVVALRGRLFGKPADAQEARSMLQTLSGESHEVITAVAVARAGRPETHVEFERTTVTFRALEPAEIDAYVDTGSVFDKAGAYAIQEGAGRFVERIAGDYFNVVGLPCALLASLLRSAGFQEHIQVPAPPDRWAAT